MTKLNLVLYFFKFFMAKYGDWNTYFIWLEEKGWWNVMCTLEGNGTEGETFVTSSLQC